jgi:hypothetical protein
MSNKNKANYGAGPWPINRSLIEGFIKVTESNRKQAVVYGRILYIIDPSGSNYIFRGTMSVDPYFDRGWHHYPWKPWQGKTGHFRVFMTNGVPYDEWKDANKKLINTYIAEGSLYIKQSDPILTYIKEN